VINLLPGDNTAGIIRGSFLARYPLDLVWTNVHLAPYAYGIAGVGGLFSGYEGLRSNGSRRFSNRGLGDFGGGLEYRFTPHIGVFSEATWNVVDWASTLPRSEKSVV
jgi:hypothetical protein